MSNICSIVYVFCPLCNGKTVTEIDRWQNISKIMIASARYRLGISIIANKLSATGDYFTHQMVA